MRREGVGERRQIWIFEATALKISAETETVRNFVL
jgi:hypothetical protein